LKILFIIFFLLPSICQAKLRLVTTTTNLKSLAEYIGGEKVEVTSLCKGTQDPHYLEAKPSYAIRLAKADLLLSIGLGLEDGWLPLIVRGSRNPDLRYHKKGSFVASDYVELLEVHDGKAARVTRAEGDVHPEGNPHFLLSPLQSLKVATALAKKLSELDAINNTYFESQLMKFKSLINNKNKLWKSAVKKGIKVVTYHKTLTYFYDHFEITNIGFLEPKPGIAPSAAHVMRLIKVMKNKNVERILVENYFDDAVAKKIQSEIPQIKIHSVPVAVEGGPGSNNLIDLFDLLVGVFK